ncbi:hypothetical protein EHQ94_11020 [Leptospira meyeri]|uniref:hypothetical protein n=1 Tax=Leptospira meyeri TaxID=29508 RepID=UPI0010829D09|nr:hypothetical protein [Leptospira meyeri]TGM60620.1 hypothetical protein EHQ93_17865 [Leptospira meyeri]TGM66476.1 hypothetical protein EHQ94_11020 [Leptospira meyeri]
MKHYILNIIEEINENRINTVDDWMEKNFAPIFFGNSNVNDIIKNRKPKDAYLFCSEGQKEEWLNCKIISLGIYDIYIYTPIEHVKDYNEIYKVANNLTKGCKIKILEKIPIKKAPLVLASIKSNTYLGRGTFKEISGRQFTYQGNVNAIEYLSNRLNSEIIVNSFEDYLFCLSSLEFETLIAKLFEEMDFHVPAYKGGFLKDLDLIVKNNKHYTINAYQLSVEPGQTLSIQTKLIMDQPDNHCDLSVSINNLKSENHIGHSKLEILLNKYPKTKDWLKETLFWVKINVA